MIAPHTACEQNRVKTVRADNRQKTMTTTQSANAAGADEHYLSALSGFTDAVEQAIVSSHAATGLDAGQRRYWGSVLFTRLCTTSVSILLLCPGSKVNPDGTHWDFGSVASLARNLFECALQFFYLAVEPVNDDEWYARLKVMQLHDCRERMRMFRAFNPNDPQLRGFEQQAGELKSLLTGNSCFRSLPQALRKNLLKGERPSILTQDEILERMGQAPPDVRGYYRFLSSHAHSLPLAYYRMAEHDRGRGEENRVEKGYIAGTLEFCTDLLKRSIDGFQKSFADIASFAPATFSWEVLRKRS
jgi:hypothetical protein